MSSEITWQLSRIVAALEMIEKQLVEIDASLHPPALDQVDGDIEEVIADV